MIMVMISSQEFSNCLFPLFATPDSNTISQEQWLSQMRTSTPRFFANITTITRAYKLNHSGDQQLGRPSGSQSGARGFARGDRLPHMQVITIMIEEDFVREAVKCQKLLFFPLRVGVGIPPLSAKDFWAG